MTNWRDCSRKIFTKKNKGYTRIYKKEMMKKIYIAGVDKNKLKRGVYYSFVVGAPTNNKREKREENGRFDGYVMGCEMYIRIIQDTKNNNKMVLAAPLAWIETVSIRVFEELPCDVNQYINSF